MKTTKLVAIIILFSAILFSNDVGKSVVVKRMNSCDFFILYNSRGYVVAEHYSGKDFDEDYYVYGNINKYGYVNVYDSDLSNSEKIYVEEWAMSKESAYELLVEKCN